MAVAAESHCYFLIIEDFSPITQALPAMSRVYSFVRINDTTNTMKYQVFFIKIVSIID